MFKILGFKKERGLRGISPLVSLGKFNLCTFKLRLREQPFPFWNWWEVDEEAAYSVALAQVYFSVGSGGGRVELVAVPVSLGHS